MMCCVQVCRFNCPEPVCGDVGGGVAAVAADLPGLQLAAAPPASYTGPNQRSFQVDPRLPSRPAGLVMDEDALDQLRAPSTAAQQALAAAGLHQFVAGKQQALAAAELHQFVAGKQQALAAVGLHQFVAGKQQALAAAELQQFVAVKQQALAAAGLQQFVAGKQQALRAAGLQQSVAGKQQTLAAAGLQQFVAGKQQALAAAGLQKFVAGEKHAGAAAIIQQLALQQAKNMLEQLLSYSSLHCSRRKACWSRRYHTAACSRSSQIAFMSNVHGDLYSIIYCTVLCGRVEGF